MIDLKVQFEQNANFVFTCAQALPIRNTLDECRIPHKICIHTYACAHTHTHPSCIYQQPQLTMCVMRHSDPQASSIQMTSFQIHNPSSAADPLKPTSAGQFPITCTFQNLALGVSSRLGPSLGVSLCLSDSFPGKVVVGEIGLKRKRKILILQSYPLV